MGYKTLCWRCKNCCSINDCEFVYKINKYYRSISSIVDENGNVKLIRDLTKYYIPGTKTDTQGNILFCPKFEEDGLNHKSESYQKFELSGRKNFQCYLEREKLLDNYFEVMSKMTQEEKEARQEAFYQKVLKEREKKQKVKINIRNYYKVKKVANGRQYIYYYDKKTRKRIKLEDIGGYDNDLSKC